MKKTVFIISMLALLVGNAAAQDTLTSYYPKEGYYYDSWFHGHGYYASGNTLMPYNGYVYAIFFHTDDTLPVYGIGASLYTPDLTYDPVTEHSPYPWVIDTSWKEAYEYLGLYRWVGDSLQTASDSLYVHMAETPISYYFKWDRPLWSSANDSVFPFYERYFDEPVMMTDTFLAGITMRTSWVVMHGDHETDSFYIRPVWIHGIAATDYNDPIEIKGMTKYKHFDTIRHLIVSRDYHDLPYRLEMVYYPLIFPILLPPDTTGVDTTIVDTTIVDTVGIADVQLVGRYVALQPNPASERVRVTSSFGLQRIEIYNAAGARVREERASGYTATLDLSTLPEGAYLVRVHTPAGSTTKKLVVQRR